MGKKLKGRRSPNGFAQKSGKGKIKTINIGGEQNKVHLFNRDRTIKFLKFCNWMTTESDEVRKFMKGEVDLPSKVSSHEEFNDVMEFIEGFTQCDDDFARFKPLEIWNSKTLAIPFSIFHNLDDDECLYSPITPENYFEIIGQGNFVGRDKNRFGKTLFLGSTPVNTFKFPLDQISYLEEILPYKTPTMDELIAIGQLDEDIQPFREDQIHQECASLKKLIGKKDFKKFYKHSDEGELQIRVTEKNGMTGFQPVKTRKMWERVVGSCPVQWNESKSKILVPMFNVKDSWEFK